MAIGKLPIAGALALGTAGAAGGGYFIYSRNTNQEENNLKSKYRLAVLVTQADWDKKFAVLKAENTTAPTYAPLKASYDEKTKNETEAKKLHKQACEGVYKLSKETTDNLEEFIKYCFFNNLDKVESGKSLITVNSGFQNKYSTFTAKKEEELSPELVDALRNKGSADTHTEWQNKMVEGCKKLSEKVYEGDNEDFKNFCLK